MTWGTRRTALGVLVVALAAAAPAVAAERGLWVDRASWQDPPTANRLIDDAATAGFTLLLLELPLGETHGRLTGRGDPLPAFVASAHARGLQVHAWIQASRILVSGALPASGDHPVRAHPEWVMIPRALATELARLDPHNPTYLGTLDRWAREHRDEMDGLYLSPLVPDAAAFLADRLGALLQRVPFDGVQIDSAHLPSSDFDYGPVAVRQFREEVAGALPPLERQQLDARAAIDPRIYPDAFPQQWSRFRRSRVTALVARLGASARQSRAAIQVSVVVAADPDEALGRHQQDWRTWVEVGFVDAICLTPGTESQEEFQQRVVAASTMVGSTALWAGVAAHLLSPGDTFERIRTARRLGIDGLVVWSYDAVVDSTRYPEGHLRQIGLALSTGVRP